MHKCIVILLMLFVSRGALSSEDLFYFSQDDDKERFCKYRTITAESNLTYEECMRLLKDGRFARWEDKYVQNMFISPEFCVTCTDGKNHFSKGNITRSKDECVINKICVESIKNKAYPQPIISECISAREKKRECLTWYEEDFVDKGGGYFDPKLLRECTRVAVKKVSKSYFSDCLDTIRNLNATPELNSCIDEYEKLWGQDLAECFKEHRKSSEPNCEYSYQPLMLQVSRRIKSEKAKTLLKRSLICSKCYSCKERLQKLDEEQFYGSNLKEKTKLCELRNRTHEEVENALLSINIAKEQTDDYTTGLIGQLEKCNSIERTAHSKGSSSSPLRQDQPANGSGIGTAD